MTTAHRHFRTGGLEGLSGGEGRAQRETERKKMCFIKNGPAHPNAKLYEEI